MIDAFSFFDEKGDGEIKTSDLGMALRCIGAVISDEQIEEIVGLLLFAKAPVSLTTLHYRFVQVDRKIQ